MIIIALLVIVIVVIFYFFFTELGSISAKHNNDMEENNVEHIRELQKLYRISLSYAPIIDIEVRYLVPHEKQMLWTRLSNNIRVRLYTSNYVVKGTDGVDRHSRCSRTISKKAYFYLKMKGWVDTPDKELALRGLAHLKWRKDIP